MPLRGYGETGSVRFSLQKSGSCDCLWRAVDHEGEALESFVTKTCDNKAALKVLKKSLKRPGRAEELVTVRFPPMALHSRNSASATGRKPAAG
ncbi:DDE-type integrase/transposase/recombinase [Hoeflea sp. IMCC20628]|uniref:DDE-type integrase/transposase/recombinase n=1 Tax=Hoeflea sp. IMCC20628 TaxID=1620421 RepID=UPI002477ECAE|nr:DDE-type integrase/transposase/recombinase [Hoeflea sp. IMCC20628]